MRKFLGTTFCLIMLLGTSIGSAQSGVPSNVQAAIFYKILKYDRNTVSRSQGHIGFVIILDGKATNRKNEISAGFVLINGQAIEGATIKVSAVTLLSADRLPAAMQATGGNILYLPQGTTPETAAAVVAYAKTNRVPVFTDDPTLAGNGAAVCIVAEDGAPKMIIHLPMSQAQGMALSADVLRLAKVIR